jgi:hypothetical protein
MSPRILQNKSAGGSSRDAGPGSTSTAIWTRLDASSVPLEEIDRVGRIAAVYVGLVDKENVESNIQAMVAER